MDIEKAIEILQTGLSTGTALPADLLFNVYVSIDPYEELEAKLTKQNVVLIEDDTTDLDNAAQGDPVRQTHNITFTCLVKAQDVNRKVYKTAVNTLMKNTIIKLMNIENDNILRIIPGQLQHGELTLGSFKASAIVIKSKVQTYWMDLQ